MNLFVYGSLMEPRVFRLVTHLDLPSAPALLSDHARYRIAGQTYPALIPEPGKATTGRVVFDVPGNALRRLDRFEGKWYERVPVEVETDLGRCQAEVYRFHPSQRFRILPQEWALEEFQRRHLHGFLRRYRGFARVVTGQN